MKEVKKAAISMKITKHHDGCRLKGKTKFAGLKKTKSRKGNHQRDTIKKLFDK